MPTENSSSSQSLYEEIDLLLSELKYIPETKEYWLVRTQNKFIL